MDAASLRLLFRLSLVVVVFVFSLVTIAAGVELPLGRGGRALPVLALLGSVVAILLIVGRLRGRRQPGGPPASLSPVSLVREGARQARGLTQAARARFSAQLHRRRRAARVRRAELAALAAARDDDRLAPERVAKAAEALFRLVHLARNERDPARLGTLMSAELLAQWERALDAGSAGDAHRVQVPGDVKVDLVGLTSQPAQAATVVVLIEAELELTAGRSGKRVPERHGPPPKQMLCQYWTLTLGEGPFSVHAIEERHEGDHHLVEPIIVRGRPADGITRAGR